MIYFFIFILKIIINYKIILNRSRLLCPGQVDKSIVLNLLSVDINKYQQMVDQGHGPYHLSGAPMP